MRSVPSRRRFLSGLGAGAALLPLLGDQRASGAQAGGAPRRLIIVHWPNGVTAWPGVGASPADFTLPPFMKSLEPYKADSLLVAGLRFKALQDTKDPKTGVDGHSSTPSILTGKPALRLGRTCDADGISIDQHIGDALGAQGYGGLPTLNLGAVHTRDFLQWRGSDRPVVPDNDPYHVFDGLFGRPATGGDDASVERLRQARKSVLDVVAKDVERFARQVGSDDRHRIQGHLEAIRDIERQLAPGAPAAPTATALPPPALPSPRLDHMASENFPAVIKLQMELAVAALAADRSRVAVLHLGNDSNFHLTAPWLGYSDTHHDIAHNGPTAKKARLDEWYHEMFAHLLAKLRAVPEAGKTMLDSTAVVFVANMTHGLHDINRVRWIITGSCGGYFKTGRSIDVAGAPHNGVLIALANAMGVPTETFGSPAYGGELTALRG